MNPAEGYVDVPGARLGYRLAGAGPGPLLVFENGWGASYEYWVRLEALLAPHARLLFYNRGGIGGSSLDAPQTVAGVSEQLAGLLAALKVAETVVLVGHSYGGLVCAVHAAQKPQLLRALIELDPTPDSADALLDGQMKLVERVGRLTLLCARLSIPDPLFGATGKLLPAPHGRRMVERSFRSAASMRGALRELALLGELRAAAARGDGGRPHLILGAGRATVPSGLLARLLGRNAAQRAEEVMQRVREQHRRRIATCRNGSWETLPHDHGQLVFSAAGAQDAAERILRFVRGR